MGYLATLIKNRFSWLDTDEEVIGSEVISDLQSWYDYHNMQPENVIADLGLIDWKLLAEQKLILLDLIGKKKTELSEAVTGVINVIDRIQDFAVSSNQANETTVFPILKSKEPEQPSLYFEDEMFFQIGCSECDGKPGTWKIYADGKGSFITECNNCTHTTRFPPAELKKKPDQS